jgi:hypothetical protein
MVVKAPDLFHHRDAEFEDFLIKNSSFRVLCGEISEVLFTAETPSTQSKFRNSNFSDSTSSGDMKNRLFQK